MCPSTLPGFYTVPKLFKALPPTQGAGPGAGRWLQQARMYTLAQDQHCSSNMATCNSQQLMSVQKRSAEKALEEPAAKRQVRFSEPASNPDTDASDEDDGAFCAPPPPSRPTRTTVPKQCD